MKQNKSYVPFVFLLIIILLIGTFLGLALGAKDITFTTIIEALFQNDNRLDHQLIFDIRLPRVLATLMVGGLLGICGSMMQGVTRNPIAEPSTLGITQGATFAISLLFFNGALLTTTNITLMAFIGALVSGLLVILFTTNAPSNIAITRLLLAGTALSTFFISLSTIVGLLSNNSQTIAFLVGGGFRNANWQAVLLLFVASLIGIILAMLWAKKINILSLGDEMSISLGEKPNRIRVQVLLLIIVLSAISVAIGKNIMFVGLIVPHVVNRIVEKDYRYLLPVSFLCGSILLVYSDILARMLISPYEMPISIFTSLLGVPFFIYLIRKEPI